MRQLLFRELGLKGNRENYYDPDNSYLPRVLDRKLGIPISLSVITMLVARRVGFELEGIGLPGHFLVRYRSGRTETYIDSFNGGRIWTREDCLHYLQGQGGGHGVREEHLRTYTTREILIRMLANLLHIYRGREEVEKAKRVSEMIHVLVGERFTK
jgi:regulator of sirC expression with transglutaminase-like and TPR domain